MFVGFTAQGQDSVKAVNFSSQVKFKKYFTIQHPSEFELKALKCKVKDGKLYVLNNNFISGKGLLLFVIDLESNQMDSLYINLDENAYSYSDMDINNQKLYLLSNSTLIVYDLLRHTHASYKIQFQKADFLHFYVEDSANILFYEWRMGDKLTQEEKGVYNYNLENNKWTLIDNNQLDGLTFLGVNTADKHMDLNSNLLVKFKPDRYSIPIYNIKTGERDTLFRDLDTLQFISGDVIRSLNNLYNKRPKMSVFDSLDNHCYKFNRLRSIRVSGDSLVYVLFLYNLPQNVFRLNSRTEEVMDIWKKSTSTGNWELYKGNLRMDNRADTGKHDLKLMKNMYYTLLGTERHWCVYKNYLIIPKAMPTVTDLEGDLSSYYKRENFKGPMNLQIMVFEVE